MSQRAWLYEERVGTRPEASRQAYIFEAFCFSVLLFPASPPAVAAVYSLI